MIVNLFFLLIIIFFKFSISFEVFSLNLASAAQYGLQMWSNVTNKNKTHDKTTRRFCQFLIANFGGKVKMTINKT